MVVVLIIAILIVFFNPTSPTDIYTLSLHDALPIFRNALTTEKTYYVDNQAYTATVASLSAIDQKCTRLNSSHSIRSDTVSRVKDGTDVAGGVCLESDSKSGSKFFLVDITAGTQAGT